MMCQSDLKVNMALESESYQKMLTFCRQNRKLDAMSIEGDCAVLGHVLVWWRGGGVVWQQLSICTCYQSCQTPSHPPTNLRQGLHVLSIFNTPG